MPETSHDHAKWNPNHYPVDGSDIVVLVTDALFEYLPPNSGITPQEALLRVRSVIDSTAGMAAYVFDAMRPGVGAEVIVAKLAEVLDQHDSDHKERSASCSRWSRARWRWKSTTERWNAGDRGTRTAGTD